MLKFIFLIIFFFRPAIFEENTYKIVLNELSESMTAQFLGLTLPAIEQNLNYNTIAQKISNGMKQEFGSQWFCFVGPTGLFSHVDSAENSRIVFVHGSLQIILFKPIDRSQTDFISDARKTVSKISVIKNEMTESMKDHAIAMSLFALNALNDFKSISSNISASFGTLYGHKWFCFVSTNNSEFKINYIPNTFISLKISEINIILFQTYKPDINVRIILFNSIIITRVSIFRWISKRFSNVLSKKI